MAAESEHIALANRNHRALLLLLPHFGEAAEWVATISFYKAVQIAEAVFAVQPFCRNSAGHRARLETLKDPRLAGGKLYVQFNPLMTASMLARYLRDEHTNQTVSTFREYRPPEKVVSQLVMRRLRAFEQIAVGLLSEAGRDTLITLDKDSAVDPASPDGLKAAAP